MHDQANTGREPEPELTDAEIPAVVDRATFQTELDELRVQEKAHTREGDAIAAARRRLPMVEVDSTIGLIGARGPVTLLDAFEGRRQLIAYYFMWNPGRPVRRLHVGHHPGRGTVLPSFPRHHLRGLLSGAVRRKHPLPRLHGLGHAVVLSTRIRRPAPRWAPNRLVSPRVLPARRRPRVRNLLDETPRRGGNGLQLLANGPHRLRTSGALGGLAPRLATAVHHHAD